MDVRSASAILLFLLIGVPLFAEEGPSGVYEGTIGNLPVSVRLSSGTNEYYYHKIGKTIELDAFEDKPGTYLEYDPAHPRFAEDFDPKSDNTWEITSKGDTISGVWKSGSKGKTLPISLHKTNSDFETNRLSRPYAHQKNFESDGVQIDIQVHPVTGVTLPQIVSGVPKLAIDTINKNLAGDASDLNHQWPVCSDWEGGIHPEFVTKLWMTFDVDSSGYCGGTHPNEDSTPVSYDSATGESIKFENWIDLHYWSDDAIQGDLQKAVAKAYEDNTDCLDRAKEVGWNQFTTWMGPDGFNFRYDEDDRAYVACEGDYSVPFDEMRKYINEDHVKLYDKFVAAAKAIGKKH